MYTSVLGWAELDQPLPENSDGEGYYWRRKRKRTQN